MILFYMLRGMPPFLHLGGVDAAVAAAIRQERPPIPRAWDEKITHLLQAAWSENPASRPSFQKAREAHDRPLSAHLWQARVTSPPRPLLAGPRHAPRVLQGPLQGHARGRPREGGGREPRQGVRHLLSRAGATARGVGRSCTSGGRHSAGRGKQVEAVVRERAAGDFIAPA